jgi:hypothetical protein
MNKEMKAAFEEFAMANISGTTEDDFNTNASGEYRLFSTWFAFKAFCAGAEAVFK